MSNYLKGEDRIKWLHSQKGTVINNCYVDPGNLSNPLTHQWAANHERTEVTLIESGDFYETFAGDAQRFGLACDLPFFSKDGLLMVAIPKHAIKRYREIAGRAGVKIFLVDEVANVQN